MKRAEKVLLWKQSSNAKYEDLSFFVIENFRTLRISSVNLLSLKLDEQLLIVSSLRKGTPVDIYKNWNYSQWFGLGFGFGFGLRLRAMIQRPF